MLRDRIFKNRSLQVSLVPSETKSAFPPPTYSSKTKPELDPVDLVETIMPLVKIVTTGYIVCRMTNTVCAIALHTAVVKIK